MKANYHTHTYFCGHASGSAYDYAKKAIEHGFVHLGISDHAPNDLVRDYNVRMKMASLDDYFLDIDQAITKTKGKIKLFKGLEVEFWDNHEEYYSLLKRKTDYLIHGQHYVVEHHNMSKLISSFALSTKDQIQLYGDFMVKAMDSKHFTFFAHPDLYMCGYQVWDTDAEEVAHKILKKAQEVDAIFEFNANGYRRGKVNTPLGVQPLYPRKEFWALVKQYNIKTILSSDCHQPNLLYDDTMKAVEEEYNQLQFHSIEFLNL